MKEDKHWRDEKEKTLGSWQMDFMLGAYRLLGVRTLKFLIYPIVFVFCLFAPGVIRTSRNYLLKAAAFYSRKKPHLWDSYRHICSFAFSMIEKIAAWSGNIPLDSVTFHDDSVQDLIDLLDSGKGAVILCSHLGNMEILRALATYGNTRTNRQFRVTSIVDFSGTEKFNKMIRKVNPQSMMRLVNARDIGIDTVLDLQTRLASGELLVIAADRVSSTTKHKTESVSFLGHPAQFPQGAFVLASVMEAPFFYMFGLRKEDMRPAESFDFHVVQSGISFSGSKKERKEKITGAIQEYVQLLEKHLEPHPLQWFNFYNFWNQYYIKGDKK